jgi:hypothetical protein
MISGQDEDRKQMTISEFKEEAARFRREFDVKISGILERIRERRLKEIKAKIQE